MFLLTQVRNAGFMLVCNAGEATLRSRYHDKPRVTVFDWRSSYDPFCPFHLGKDTTTCEFQSPRRIPKPSTMMDLEDISNAFPPNNRSTDVPTTQLVDTLAKTHMDPGKGLEDGLPPAPVRFWGRVHVVRSTDRLRLRSGRRPTFGRLSGRDRQERGFAKGLWNGGFGRASWRNAMGVGVPQVVPQVRLEVYLIGVGVWSVRDQHLPQKRAVQGEYSLEVYSKETCCVDSW